jgi:hypothetical protein
MRNLIVRNKEREYRFNLYAGVIDYSSHKIGK